MQIEYIILIILLSLSSSAYPIAYFHGINTSCKGPRNLRLLSKLQSDLPDTYIECIEIGTGYFDTFFLSMFKQGNYACNALKCNPHFQDKFSIIALSQGNLIARYVIENCKMPGTVVDYLSFDGPHMGIGQIPLLDFFPEFISKAANYIVWQDIPWLAEIFAPASYFRLKYENSDYKRRNIFLQDLNNEFDDKNEHHRKMFMSLRKVMLIKGREDLTINPRESSWFEFWDEKGEKIVPLKESKFYRDDYIGLRSLVEDGKVTFVEFQGGHLDYTEEEYRNFILGFFKE